MKPTLEEVMKTVQAMSQVIPFFPTEELAKLLLAQIIHKFVNTTDELGWLAVAACGNVRDWERSGGVVELRGIFCTRFRPADGIETYSTSPGFTPADLESRSVELPNAGDERRFTEYQRDALTAPAEDRQPFQLGELKKIPEVSKPNCQSCGANGYIETAGGVFARCTQCRNGSEFPDALLNLLNTEPGPKATIESRIRNAIRVDEILGRS